MLILSTTSEQPNRTRNHLAKAAKVRGLRWKFALLNNAVVIKRKMK